MGRKFLKNITTELVKRALCVAIIIIDRNAMKRFLSKRKQIILNVNINWMQITAHKVLNFNVDTFTFSFIPHKKKLNLGISNDVLVRRNITYPILSSSTWRILSARSKTFLMISFSLSVISVFLPVFLAGPLEWKDHPEFSLKMRWKKTFTNDVLQLSAFIYQLIFN